MDTKVTIVPDETTLMKFSPRFRSYPIALPAGIGKMPQLRFHIYTFIGSWPWCFALAWIGMKLGQRWDTDPRLKHALHRFDAIILIFGVIAVAWFIRSHWRQRMRAQSA